jgi:hypothetical protein
MTALFINSLNAMMYLHAKRHIAIVNHVPEPIIPVLLAVAMLS